MYAINYNQVPEQFWNVDPTNPTAREWQLVMKAAQDDDFFYTYLPWLKLFGKFKEGIPEEQLQLQENFRICDDLINLFMPMDRHYRRKIATKKFHRMERIFKLRHEKNLPDGEEKRKLFIHRRREDQRRLAGHDDRREKDIERARRRRAQQALLSEQIGMVFEDKQVEMEEWAKMEEDFQGPDSQYLDPMWEEDDADENPLDDHVPEGWYDPAIYDYMFDDLNTRHRQLYAETYNAIGDDLDRLAEEEYLRDKTLFEDWGE